MGSAGRPLLEMFNELDYSDMCEDANLLAVVCYLKGSKKLSIPAQWRAFIPKELPVKSSK